MAGARRASAKTRLYVRPRVVLPNKDTIPYAIRLPNPDLINPPDSQNAMAMSHLHFSSTQPCPAIDFPQRSTRRLLATYGISLANALKAAPKVRTFVSMVAPNPSTATAPRGRGCVMMPTIVDKKIANRCHAWVVTPAKDLFFSSILSSNGLLRVFWKQAFA